MDMQPATLAARSIGVVQQVAMAAHIIFKYFHAIEQQFACCPKWKLAVGIISYASRGIFYTQYFLYETVFKLSELIMTLV